MNLFKKTKKKYTEDHVEIFVYLRKQNLDKEIYDLVKEAFEKGYYDKSDGCTMVPDLPLRIAKNPICIMHDYLLDTKKFPKKQTDKLFKKGLIQLGYPILGRIYYLGVRAFGWIFLKKKSKN